MSYILNIDTATEAAHVSLAQNGVVLQQLANQTQNEHAAFVQPAAAALVKAAGISFAQLCAVAVTAGPGSYTGLRVGMASAKGLCYALNKPLIALNTLQIMAAAAQMQHTEKNILFCPMIDARRMEVFTALYDDALNIILEPCAMILTTESFKDYLVNNKILFFGNGSKKWNNLINHSNALFTDVSSTTQAMAQLSDKNLIKNNFSNLAYTEPLYLKEFNAGV
jgi:tRNA threonylcarbamoyladenosine biosynthesis protein TsaB